MGLGVAATDDVMRLLSSSMGLASVDPPSPLNRALAGDCMNATCAATDAHTHTHTHTHTYQDRWMHVGVQALRARARTSSSLSMHHIRIRQAACRVLPMSYLDVVHVHATLHGMPQHVVV